MVKIYYESWQYQCCGDAFKIGDIIKWDVAKFNEKDWIFKDADFMYEAHDMAEYEVHGRVMRIWEISYEYEYNEKQKSILPINYQKKEIKDIHTACGDYLIEIDEFAKE